MVASLSEWRRGWPTVLSGSMGTGMLGAAVIVTGVIMAPITETFGWSRSVVSSNIFIIALLQLVLAPVAGMIIGRFGVRRYVIASVAAAGPGLLLIGFAGPHEMSWYVAWIVFGSISVGLSPLVWSTAIAMLFDRARGLALAIALSGGGLSYLFFPSIAVLVTTKFGWRGVYVMLATIYL